MLKKENVKKICVVTATRAEYGLMRNLIKIINEDKDLRLCLVVTGTHLSKEHGYTKDEIIADGFPITAEIDILSKRDDAVGIAYTMANAAKLFADVLEEHKPDIVVVLGDRYELLSICGSALVAQIPIAHISGGEITEGAIDDCIRHCLTKLSALHFPGCEDYRKRIIQLGEQPNSVFNFGDPGVENILQMDFVSKNDLEKDLKICLDNVICMTFHPVTTMAGEEKEQLEQVLKAVENFPEYTFVATKANADRGGQRINEILEEYEKTHANFHLFASLGIRRYLSLLKLSKLVLGNSSSGIVEAPALHKPTVNIGDRQKGRLMADSIISCETKTEDIIKAVTLALSDGFQEKASVAKSLYGSGETSKLIVQKIKEYLMENTKYIAKKFYDF